MQYATKTYDCNLGKRIYVEYYNDETGETFTNAEYYILDMQNDDLKQKLESVGGFCANIMHRIANERGIEGIDKIMFACTPKETNQFEFLILYLGENDEAKLTLLGDNYFDWKYFKNKFVEAVVEEGFVYDLEGKPYFESIRDAFVDQSSEHFGIKIDGLEIKYGQILFLKDISVINLKDSAKESLGKIGSNSALLRLYTGVMTGTNVEFCFIDGNKNLVCRQQMKDSNLDRELYASELFDKIKNNSNVRPERVNQAFDEALTENLQPEWVRFVPVKSLVTWAEGNLLEIVKENECKQYFCRSLAEYKYLLKNSN